MFLRMYYIPSIPLAVKFTAKKAYNFFPCGLYFLTVNTRISLNTTVHSILRSGWTRTVPPTIKVRRRHGLESFKTVCAFDQILLLKLFPNQFSSVAQWWPTLCDTMDCSTPGLPVYHQLRSLFKIVSIESVMSSNHLILYQPILLLPSNFLSIRVFSNDSVLCIKWPNCWELRLQRQYFQWIFRTDFL